MRRALVVLAGALAPEPEDLTCPTTMRQHGRGLYAAGSEPQGFSSAYRIADDGLVD